MNYFSELQRKNGGAVVSMVAAVVTALISLVGVFMFMLKPKDRLKNVVEKIINRKKTRFSFGQ